MSDLNHTLEKPNNQTSPQSSLGDLGKSLLKFIAPVMKVAPHLTPYKLPAALIFSKNPVKEGETSSKKEAILQEKPISEAASSTSVPLQGIIRPTREPATPWIQVVMNLIESCEESSQVSRQQIGSSTYGAVGGGQMELRRKTIGRIINVKTEDGNTDDDADEKKEKLKKTEKPKDSKPQKKVA